MQYLVIKHIISFSTEQKKLLQVAQIYVVAISKHRA